MKVKLKRKKMQKMHCLQILLEAVKAQGSKKEIFLMPQLLPVMIEAKEMIDEVIENELHEMRVKLMTPIMSKMKIQNIKVIKDTGPL